MDRMKIFVPIALRNATDKQSTYTFKLACFSVSEPKSAKLESFQSYFLALTNPDMFSRWWRLRKRRFSAEFSEWWVPCIKLLAGGRCLTTELINLNCSRHAHSWRQYQIGLSGYIAEVNRSTYYCYYFFTIVFKIICAPNITKKLFQIPSNLANPANYCGKIMIFIRFAAALPSLSQ